MNHKSTLSTSCFPPDLTAGETRQPLPSHVRGDADRAPLGADGWTLHLVMEDDRVSESQENEMQSCDGWFVFCYFYFLSRPGDVYRVVLGEHDMSVQEGTEQVRDILRIIVHPEWDIDFVGDG